MRGLVNQRYRILRKLGKGGMGVVYLVEDTLCGNQQMALKTIHAKALEAHSLAQFKYEFAALRQLRHPNLVSVYDFDIHSKTGEYFYTMEHVPGDDLPKLIRQRLTNPTPPAAHAHAGLVRRLGSDPTWLYDIVVQVCRALQYLHSRGLIHYDVKPANIRITPDGQAHLIDLGLIGEPRDGGHIKIRGTPEYIAPELICGMAVDQRADLYSLGVSLYEIAANRLPFTGESSLMVLRQHVEASPPLPRRFVSDIPEGLQALILKLMAKEPAQRYASAGQVIEAINDITPGPQYPLETRLTRLSYIQSGRLVGREFELTRLNGLLMRSLQNEGRLVLISGPTGTGKTRLAREMKLQAQMRRVLVCEGACQEQNRAPYHPWVSVFEQVLAHRRASGMRVSSADIRVLQRLMPGLERSPFPNGPANEPSQDRQSLLESATRILLQSDRPQMVVLEDLQYADSETIEFLSYLGRRARSAKLLVIGLYRDDELPRHHPLHGLVAQSGLIQAVRAEGAPFEGVLAPDPSVAAVAADPGGTQDGEPTAREQAEPFDRLALHALDAAGIEGLVRSMLGMGEAGQKEHQALLQALVSRLMQETGGNPLFIEAVMRSLVDEDLLTYDGRLWRIDLAGLKDEPAGIREVAARRLARLDRRALSLLKWAAAIGRQMDLDLLRSVSGLPAEEIYQILAEGVQTNVLSAVPQSGGHLLYSFSTDSMREAIAKTLTANQRRERHRVIGETLAAAVPGGTQGPEGPGGSSGKGGPAGKGSRIRKGSPGGAAGGSAGGSAGGCASELSTLASNPERLAWHFERAGKMALALDYTRQAAERARMVHANESAIDHYTHALQLAAQNCDLATQAEVYQLLANREESNRLVGDRFAQQTDLDLMEAIAAGLDDNTLKLDVVTRRVNLAVLLGDHHHARLAGRAGLELARRLGDQKLEADCLASISEASYWLDDFAGTQTCAEQALMLYQQLLDLSGQAKSLRLLALAHRRHDRQAESKSCFEQALAIYRSLGNRLGEADTLNGLGVISTNYAQKRSYFEQSMVISEGTGDRYRQARVYNNLGLLYSNLGLYRKACHYLEMGVQIQRETRAKASLMYSLESLGRVYLELDDYARARSLLEEGCCLAVETGSPLNEALFWLSLGRLELAEGRPETARDLIAQAYERQAKLEAMNYMITSQAWLGYAYLKLNDLESAENHTRQAIRNLEQTGNTGSFPSQDVWWLYYQVINTLLMKDPQPDENGNQERKGEAWNALHRAHDAMLSTIATLSDEGLRRNYLNRVRINHQILTEWVRVTGPSLAEQEPEISELSEDARLTRAELLAVKDKFKRVLDISLRMNETRDLGILLEYVMDQVIELSGAERGYLVLFDSHGRMDFKVRRGISAAELERTRSQLSYTVMGAVAQSKQPILLQDALADEHFGRQSSVLDLHLRSVLCVPLLAHGDLIGAIYSDNRSISGRFSQADVDLLTIFASQAAAAIENARLHQESLRANKELNHLAQTLEQRVTERTSELKKRSREIQSANRALTQRAVQLRTSSQVSHQVTSILDVDRLLPEVARLIQNAFGYDFVGVWLLTEDEAYVELGAGIAAGQPPLPRLRRSLEMPGLITGVCRSGEFCFVEDVSDTHAYPESSIIPQHGSALALPLRMGQRTIGVLEIRRLGTVVLDEDDRMVHQTLADQIAIAIRNAQLYHKELKRREFAEALERTGRELSGSLDIREVSARVLHQLAVVMPYERGAIWLRQEDKLLMVAQRGFPDQQRALELQIQIREDDVFEQLVRKRQPVTVSDVSVEPGWNQEEWMPLDRAWMGVPLISKDRVVGMLSLTRKAAGAFGETDAQRATTFGYQAAIALENASLYDAITRFKEQLEQIVQERTNALNQAYRDLERLDRAKTDFIDIAAHELRTPLTSIHGYNYLLLENDKVVEDTALTGLAKGIQKGATQLHEIVNSMLDVAQIDNQTLQMRRDFVKLPLLAHKVRSDFQAALQDRQQTFDLSGLNNLPAIKADAHLLYKVFHHLVMNAIKYTPDGGRISMYGEVVGGDTARQEVEIVVSDTGIGIAPEEHQLIFEKFYQTGRVSFHSSGKTKYKGGGPGLGLAIARGIVQAHGGQIWVESHGFDEVGCPGSLFHVRLPVS